MKIDKNLPMPDFSVTGRSPKGQSKYGFHKMEVGDSIFFEGESLSTMSSPYAAMKAWNRKGYSQLKAANEEGGWKGKDFWPQDNGIRIWRVS